MVNNGVCVDVGVLVWSVFGILRMDDYCHFHDLFSVDCTVLVELDGDTFLLIAVLGK